MPHRAEPLEVELQSFVKRIKNDEEPPMAGQDGLRALEMAMLCLQRGG